MKTTSVHQRLETPTETDTQEHVYQKPWGASMSWSSIWLKRGQQPINQSIFICDKNTGQQGWITALTDTLKRNTND